MTFNKNVELSLFSKENNPLKCSNRRSVMRFIGASATAAGLTLFLPKLSMAKLDDSLAHISNPRIIGQADAPIHVVEYSQ